MIEVPCGYVSRKFTDAERKRQSVVECEMTALIFTITAFSYYLVGRPSFTVRTDAASLIYIYRFKDSNSRLMRAALWLSEYNFSIQHMKCNNNAEDNPRGRSPQPTPGAVDQIQAVNDKGRWQTEDAFDLLPSILQPSRSASGGGSCTRSSYKMPCRAETL